MHSLELAARKKNVLVTLYALKDSSLCFNTINLACSLVYIEGSHAYHRLQFSNKIVFLFLKIIYVFVVNKQAV